MLQLQSKDYCKMKGVSYEFMFSLKTITFYCKKIYHLLYNPICGLFMPFKSEAVNVSVL